MQLPVWEPDQKWDPKKANKKIRNAIYISQMLWNSSGGFILRNSGVKWALTSWFLCLQPDTGTGQSRACEHVIQWWCTKLQIEFTASLWVTGCVERILNIAACRTHARSNYINLNPAFYTLCCSSCTFITLLYCLCVKTLEYTHSEQYVYAQHLYWSSCTEGLYIITE